MSVWTAASFKNRSEQENTSQVQANVLTLIRSRHDESLNPLPELTTQLREHQFYIPDVAVEDLYKPIVILCIEVVSPPDRVGKLFGKCEEYHSWGVPDCWVIDPERKIAWEYFPADLEPRKVETALTAGSINLDLADVFWRV